jgi:probable F420-dependent oxidoreductase
MQGASTRLGCSIPTTGSLPLDIGLDRMARLAEEAGAQSLWVSDHIAMFRESSSRYPFSPDGKPVWSPDTPWLEAFTVLGWVAAATRSASVGTGVLVLPQRDPVLVAKTTASIDALAGGRVVLGVGPGWLKEEFDLLRYSFRDRGRRMEEAIAVLRSCWSGSPDEFHGEFFDLPAGVLCYPRPVREGGIPILIGGMSERAVERAGRLGDGWLPLVRLDEFDAGGLEARLERARAARPPGAGPFYAALKVYGAIDAAGLDILARAAALGFDEISISIDWHDPEVACATIALAREAVASG